MENFEPIKLEKTDNNIIVTRIMNSLMCKGRNILIHGPGGVGKSYTIANVIKKIKDTEIAEIGCISKIYVTATTGTAAVNLSCGENWVNMGEPVTTLHKFAGVGIDHKKPINDLLNIMKKYSPTAIGRWIKCDILIIDEVSMLSASFFEVLNLLAQRIRKKSTFFGGIQIIACGDFLQLPPVKEQWVFTSNIWNSLNFKTFIFETPKRYDDLEFFNMLLRIRKGQITDLDCKILKIRIGSYKKLIKIINSYTLDQAKDIIKPTVLYSKRVDVNGFNDKELAKLPGVYTTFTAFDDFCGFSEIEMDIHKKGLDEIIDPIIKLKVGAQVMLTINLDPERGFANGSRGVIEELYENIGAMVMFLNGNIMMITLHEWTIEYKKGRCTKRSQIPLKLAYALTIHKSQGCTLDYAVLDLGQSIFADGQAYVALSRCRNIKGLFISNFSRNSIVANKEALNYDNKIRDPLMIVKKLCIIKEYSKKIEFPLDIIDFILIILVKFHLKKVM